jgi:hypothetical protein
MAHALSAPPHLIFVADVALAAGLPVGWEKLAGGAREPPMYICRGTGLAQWEAPGMSGARGLLAALTGAGLPACVSQDESSRAKLPSRGQTVVQGQRSKMKMVG